MSQTLLSCVEIDSARTATAAVIWLHGLGASGHDFEPIVPELRLPPALPVRFVFPHAPTRPVTLNGGMLMPAWFDIRELSLERGLDLEGLDEAAAQTRALIEREVARGVAPEHIVLAGFSQGGAVALHVGLRHPQRLAGIMALSTFNATAGTLPEQASTANRGLPVFMAHGTEDPMLAVEPARAAGQTLAQLGYACQWREYPMGHMVCREEIDDISRWLVEVFDPVAS